MTEGSALAAGRGEMDGEHRVQMSLIFALEQALESGLGKDGVKDLVTQLIAFTNVHFMSEQLLMRFAAYPDIGMHEAEHDGLMDQLRRIESSFVLGDSRMMISESQVLRHLLVEHIRTHDLFFSQYLSDSAA
ncbi:MAG: hemerythrin family protein [Magnetospirillum sp.]|nr:hemerythrin family protein [Magnetospirillum sp.]